MDADDFNPDRFIDEKGELLPPIADTVGGGSIIGKVACASDADYSP